jgi:uncharacterized protein (TIGR00730 family)
MQAAAEALGKGMAAQNIRLIYGGGRIGLMGIVADAVLGSGGEVIGIIPEFLSRREVAHEGLTEHHVTDTMHSRKTKMFALADVFITMPGGLGTLDETVEIVTWRQLGLHDKPILICNAGGWARGLLAAFEATMEDGFADASAADLYEVLPTVDAVLDRLKTLSPSPDADTSRL